MHPSCDRRAVRLIKYAPPRATVVTVPRPAAAPAVGGLADLLVALAVLALLSAGGL